MGNVLLHGDSRLMLSHTTLIPIRNSLCLILIMLQEIPTYISRHFKTTTYLRNTVYHFHNLYFQRISCTFSDYMIRSVTDQTVPIIRKGP